MGEISLGKRMKNARLEANLTQQDLAGNHITRNMLSKIEADVASPSLKTLQHLAERLEKPISYFLRNNYDKDESIYESSRSSFDHALFLFKNKEYEMCTLYTKQILKTIQETSSNKYYAYLLYILCKCSIELENFDLVEGRLNTAIKILENAIENNVDNYYLADAYYLKSTILFSKEKFSDAEFYIKKAIDFFNKTYINDILSEIKYSFSLGYILYKKGDYKKSIEVLKNLLQFCKSTKSYYRLGDTYNLLYSMYKDTKDIEQAIYYASKAILYFDSIEEPGLKAENQKNLGNCYILIGDYEKASIYLNLSLKYYEGMDDKLMINTIRSYILEFMVRNRDYSKSFDFANKIQVNILNPIDKARVYLYLGNSYLNIKDFSNAEKYLEMSEILLKDSNDYELLNTIANSLSDMFFQLNNLEKAYEYLQNSKNYLKLSLEKNKGNQISI